MPELPEVETMRRGIAHLAGLRIASVAFPRHTVRPISLRPAADRMQQWLAGRTIAAVHRFGEIGFAGQVFRNQMLVVTDLPEPNIDMIIGADYLARRHIWLSYARRRAFIEMPAK